MSDKVINLMKLREMTGLKKDWNGYGAKPIPHSLIKKCINVIIDLPEEQQPQVFATGRQSIQFEFERPAGT